MKKLDRFILRDILSDGSAGTVYKADEVLPGDNRRPLLPKSLDKSRVERRAGHFRRHSKRFFEFREFVPPRWQLHFGKQHPELLPHFLGSGPIRFQQTLHLKIFRLQPLIAAAR